jgi:hypothetical protein
MDRCPTCHRKKKRSSQANARYWALVYKIAENVRVGADIFSGKAWHLHFKSKFLGCDDIPMPDGTVMTVARSSADEDSPEFAEYMTKVEAWAATEHNVYLDEL